MVDANEIKKNVEQKLLDLDVTLRKNAHVQKIEETTKVRPSFLALGLGLLLVIIFVAIAGVSALATLIGFAFPALASFQTLNSKNDADIKQWLTYWPLFALFSLLESFPEEAYQWIPLYYFIKIGALLWAQLPQTRGAELVYERAISKIVAQLDGAQAQAQPQAAQ